MVLTSLDGGEYDPQGPQGPRVLVLGWDAGTPGGRIAEVASALAGCPALTGALTRASEARVHPRAHGVEIIAVPRPQIGRTPRAAGGLLRRLAAARTLQPYRTDPARARLAEYLQRVPADLVHVLDRRWLPAVSVAYPADATASTEGQHRTPAIVVDPGLGSDPDSPPGAVEVAERSVDAMTEAYARTGVVPRWEPGPAPVVQRHVSSGANRRIGIGMSNFAGQGWQWMSALRGELPTASTIVLAKEQEGINFPADVIIPPAQYRIDPIYRGWIRREALGTWTNAILESGRGILGGYSGSLSTNVDELRRWGVEPALLFHGTDLRDPAAHAAAHPHSPYRDSADPWVQQQQRRTDLAQAEARTTGAPVFVSTPDLIQYLPGEARWLPVVSTMVSQRGDREPPSKPVVLHAPSDSRKKGSVLVDPVLEGLDDQGLIEYRRLRGVPPDQMAAMLSDSDIVVDQFGVGIYGVLAVEAMRCGAVVVSDVDVDVREFVLDETGFEVPIVQATPETLAEVISELVGDRARMAALSQDGLAFAEAVHDGRRSGQVLAEWVAPADTSDRPSEVN